MAPSRPLPPSDRESRPRLPLIRTSGVRLNSYTAPYSNETFSDTSPSTLPYMSGAGDGWNTPLPGRQDLRIQPTNETGFPFPPTANYMPCSHAMERLAPSADAGRHERAPSAAFEYQAFETSLRNSGRLSSILGSGDVINESDKENFGQYNVVTSANSIQQRSHKVNSMDKHPKAQRESHLLRSMQSLERLRRSPLVETATPLSIGRNYPRSRPLALRDSKHRHTSRQVYYRTNLAEDQEANTTAGSKNDGMLRQRTHWKYEEEPGRIPRDDGMEFFGDAASNIQDLM